MFLDLCKLPELPKVASLATKLNLLVEAMWAQISKKNFIGKNISRLVIGYIKVSNGLKAVVAYAGHLQPTVKDRQRRYTEQSRRRNMLYFCSTFPLWTPLLMLNPCLTISTKQLFNSWTVSTQKEPWQPETLTCDCRNQGQAAPKEQTHARWTSRRSRCTRRAYLARISPVATKHSWVIVTLSQRQGHVLTGRKQQVNVVDGITAESLSPPKSRLIPATSRHRVNILPHLTSSKSFLNGACLTFLTTSARLLQV